MQMHASQLTVDVTAVRELVSRQFPRWAPLPVRKIESTGTVNAIFRIGEDLAARFPLQPADVALTRQRLESEAAAARELAGRTAFRTPDPVAIGEPGAGYPLPWSVRTWLPGTVATEHEAGNSDMFARDLAEFVRAVRAIDTRGRTFDGTNRGGDLRAHDAWMEECFRRSDELLDVAWLRRTWARLRTLPRTATDVITHGDLIPGNLLVADGRLTGVLDVGGLAPADPALDVVIAWHGLATGPRYLFRRILGSDDLEWARGAAWAFEQAVGLVWYYAHSNAVMSRLGRRTLARIAADPSVYG